MARTATATRERTDDTAGPAPNNLPAAQDNGKAPHPLVQFKSYMNGRMGEVALALPPHMTADRFGRVVLTALQRNPALLKCTKQSLWNACMLAAQDGLLPDGREGAIVPYADGKADQATFMPMIEGLRKKARNSGEISNWEAHIVRARDHFEVVLGDQPRIDHKPYFGADEPGDIIGAYSIAWLKDGSISRDVMTIRDITKIKNISKAKNGPWSNATFFPEMCKKTVARRHYKQLPHASELDDFIKRLDEREGLSDEAVAIEGRQQQRIGSTSAAFDAFAAAGQHTIEHDPATGEVIDDAGAQQPEQRTGEQQTAQTQPAKNDATVTGAADTAQTKATEAQTSQADISKGDEVHRGDAAEPMDDELPLDGTQTSGEADAGLWPLDKTPASEADYERYATAYLAATTDREAIAGWFKGAEQRSLRTACAVGKDAFDRIKLAAANRINALPATQKK